MRQILLLLSLCVLRTTSLLPTYSNVLTNTSTTNSYFGSKISSNSEWLIVGSANNGTATGEVFFYNISSGSPVYHSSVANPDGFFGTSSSTYANNLAITNNFDRLIVSDGYTNKIFFYEFNNAINTWELISNFTGPSNSYYGDVMTIYDDYAFVKRSQNSVRSIDVYKYSSNSYSLHSNIPNPDVHSIFSNRFGNSIATYKSGSDVSLLVGSPYLNSNKGVIYAYKLVNNVFTLFQTIEPYESVPYRQFGDFMYIEHASNTLYTTDAEGNYNKLEVLNFNSTHWNYQDIIEINNNNYNSFVTYNLINMAVNGDVLIISDLKYQSYTGSFLKFYKNSTNQWVYDDYFTESGSRLFPWSLTHVGDTLYASDRYTNSNTGKVAIFGNLLAAPTVSPTTASPTTGTTTAPTVSPSSPTTGTTTAPTVSPSSPTTGTTTTPTASPTPCQCLNGGVCIDGICRCSYPYYGTKCDITKDCSACT